MILSALKAVVVSEVSHFAFLDVVLYRVAELKYTRSTYSADRNIFVLTFPHNRS